MLPDVGMPKTYPKCLEASNGGPGGGGGCYVEVTEYLFLVPELFLPVGQCTIPTSPLVFCRKRFIYKIGNDVIHETNGCC